ncbi:MAG: hypothetical protein ABI481_08400 [Pyrinomonadaceae bacterium]
MKNIFLILGLLIFVTPLFGQQPIPTATPGPGTVISEPVVQSPGPTTSVTNVTSSQSTYTPPDGATRRKRYINSLIGPVNLGRMVLRAGISTWSNSPEEWGTKWEGFGRRLASTFGKNAIKQTTTYGLDEVLKVDSHFYRSKSKSTGARIRNSLISPVTARDRTGKRVIGIPNLVGTYTAGIVSYEAWYPDRYDWKDGVRNGTFSLGLAVGFNLFKEFIWKK